MSACWSPCCFFLLINLAAVVSGRVFQALSSPKFTGVGVVKEGRSTSVEAVAVAVAQLYSSPSFASDASSSSNRV